MMTGVAIFQTLKEITDFLDEEIQIYKQMIEDYGDKLGKLLRANDSRVSKHSNSSSEKNAHEQTGWNRFGELLVHRGESSRTEAEMYFQSSDQLRTKLARLEKVKTATNKLVEAQSESGTTYVVYLREGIPERVLFRHREEVEKFVFEEEFLVQ